MNQSLDEIPGGYIIIGYPGVGKSSISGDGLFIDLESSCFKKDPGWENTYANVAKHLASQGYNVFVSSHYDVRNAILPFKNLIAVFPSLSIKDKWIHRLTLRAEHSQIFGSSVEHSKNCRALERAEEHFEYDVSELFQYCCKNEIPYICVDNTDYDLKHVIQDFLVNIGGNYDVH